MDRWQQIELLFQEALQHDPAGRDAWLREACHGDRELQRDVASLLANHDEGADFDLWAAAAAVQLIADRTSLKAGQSLGPYRIESFLAAGGMGEVYRATDTRLHRDVAIKVSAQRFSQRFEREAQVIASLNHPNICTLYDVGPNCLVMEYIEGPTLSDRIKQGALPVEEAISIGRQIIDALEAAHEKGVVHRDLKPANVKITPNAMVKVLDFGLAKAAETTVLSGSLPTVSLGATEVGVILGTAAYMSPEQAKGTPVDRRADIWAFGCVLYEMLTGKPVFCGKAAPEILASVLSAEPDWSALPPATPARIVKLLRRCLDRDPRQRLQAIGEGRIAIDAPEHEVLPPSVPLRWPWFVAGVAIVLVAALGVFAFMRFHETPPEALPTITNIEPQEDTSLVGYPPALSPDGRKIVFVSRDARGNSQLWMRALDSSAAQPVVGTDGAKFPLWSPDSRSIAFFADGKLKRIDVPGGPALTLAEAPNAYGGSWGLQNVIVFAPKPNGALQRVAASGGMPIAATTLEPNQDYSHRLPWFLSDGRHFVFADQARPGSNDILLRLGELDSREVKTLGSASSNAVYSSGHLLYLREETLMAQPFDDKRLAVTGEAQPIAVQVRKLSTGNSVFGLFSVSRDGLLAYQTEGTGGEQLTWFDRSGRPEGTLGDAGSFWSVEFSPDRKSVAVTRRGEKFDIWIYDVSRGLPTRFTFGPTEAQDPVWSPDGRDIVYLSNAKGPFDLYRKAVDGRGNEELLYVDGANKIPTSWSPDGNFLLYFRVDRVQQQDLWILPFTPGAPSKPFAWLATPFAELYAKFSPDGRWVAYTSNESGRPEIYVAPFPGTGGKRRISTGGGTFPRWRSDGKEIFYELNGKLMAAQIATKGASIEPGAIHALGIPVTAPFYRYDVSADGQRFLVAVNAPTPLTLVQNWIALLKKK